jgi:uncharacterized protein (TIGR00730 family)
MIKKACVFCGSNAGVNKAFTEGAAELAEELVKNKIDLVYGGGKVGLMGAVADNVLAFGGKVYGVIPQHLAHYEICHHGVTELKIVKDMHQRKAQMYEMSDCFIALPGGIGTLEELSEVFTWLQLCLHAKPCALLNINGFYDNFLEFLRNMVSEGFLKREHLSMLIVERAPRALIEKCKNFNYTGCDNWMSKLQ